MDRQGFVFSIDATLAVFLVVISLAAITFLSYQAESDPYGRLQVARAGKDAMAVLDYRGVLAGGNTSRIESDLNSTLPSSVGMQVELSTYYYDNGSFFLLGSSLVGPDPPGNITTYGARRDFVTTKNGVIANYTVARMKIWQK